MAKSGRPFLNASRLRVESILNASKTMSTDTGDASPDGRGGTTLESGETYVIQQAMDGGARTITLPPASKGAYVRIIWSVPDTAQSTIITTADNTNEGITGWVPYYDQAAPAGEPDGIREVGEARSILTALTVTDGPPDDGATVADMDTITLAAGTAPGSMLSFFSDGVNWYTMGCQVVGDDPFSGNSGVA